MYHGNPECRPNGAENSRGHTGHLLPGAPMHASAREGAARSSSATVTAGQGEFETGFMRGGQTKEHVVLAKSMGIKQLLIAVNKMDSVGWDRDQYIRIVETLTPFLKKTGFALDLLTVADQFLVEPLKMLCENAIQKSINVENVATMLATADARGAFGLRKKCFHYILRRSSTSFLMTWRRRR